MRFHLNENSKDLACVPMRRRSWMALVSSMAAAPAFAQTRTVTIGYQDLLGP